MSDESLVEIKASRGISGLRIPELWQYRDLLYLFAWRDIKIRYKQTFFGVAWALLQPALLMILFTLFLGKLARVPSDGIPYAPFVYAALVPWTLFAQAMTGASNSLVEGRDLVSKVYFPRLLLPLAAIASFMLDFAISFLLLIVLMVVYSIEPTPAIIWLPLFVILALMTALAAGVWLSALNAKYRDVKYALPFLVQVWLFLSPVVYPTGLVPERWQLLYALNPMAGVVEGFRWTLLSTEAPRFGILVVSTVVVILALAVGLFYFKSAERTIADVI